MSLIRAGYLLSLLHGLVLMLMCKYLVHLLPVKLSHFRSITGRTADLEMTHKNLSHLLQSLHFFLLLTHQTSGQNVLLLPNTVTGAMTKT